VTKIERSAFCLHAHFSQPPRGNPLDGTIADEPDAAPYKNWNARINETAYKPNAEIGNFDHISFSFSEGLMKWLEQEAPDTYAKIVDGEHAAFAKYAPAGNAVATAYNHIILPLARRRDKRTQIIWGIAAFERHYGRKPLGFWLPEVAVDLETLLFLAEAGIQYTILTGKQVQGLPVGGGAGPYWVELAGNQKIAVFVRNDDLSTQVSFNVHNLGGAGRWAQWVLGPARKNMGPLTLVATAGETFGHHYAGEEQFLYWLVTHEAAQAGYEITTLDRYFVNHGPTQRITIEERSSWGDHRGLSHWATGYANKDIDTTWKGALRRALDNAASEIDGVYEDLVKPYNVNPWTLRSDYLPALFSGMTADEFIKERIPGIKKNEIETLKVLFQTQRMTQRMYNSYTFTGDQLDGRQPRYAIACAAMALTMAQQATGHDLNDRLPLDLAVVTSTNTPVTGADMLRDVIKEFDLELLAK
jgi:alpha-amylase/alpha-mannosidase (GH57 family)